MGGVHRYDIEVAVFYSPIGFNARHSICLMNAAYGKMDAEVGKGKREHGELRMEDGRGTQSRVGLRWLGRNRVKLKTLLSGANAYGSNENKVDPLDSLCPTPSAIMGG